MHRSSPYKQIANKPVDTGAKAKLFAEGMRRHTMKATGDASPRFAIVMGAALVLTGIGFLVLVLRGWSTAGAVRGLRPQVSAGQR